MFRVFYKKKINRERIHFRKTEIFTWIKLKQSDYLNA